MSDQENQNQNEEEYEEENMMNMNQNENENQEEEEGHDIYAFDIQINDDIYILVIGKTEENKILLRLMEKEDQNLPKPFFQNEFSLDDLRNIHPIFNDIGEEDIAFQYLVSTLNNSDKEIKIIDESKIKFILYVQDEDEGKIEYDFLLFKTMDEDDNENENEEMMEEGIEIDNDEINNNEEQEVENNIENNDEKQKEKKEENLPIEMGKENVPKLEENIKANIPENKQVDKNENLNNIVSKNNDLEIINTNINKEEKDNKNDIKMMKDELLNIINNMNENFENKILVQNEAFNRMKEDIIKQSDEKIKLMNEELNKRDNEIITLKNTITNLEQIINEYEGKINDMNNKFINLENSNLGKNTNENKNLRNSGRKSDLENEKKIIEIKENIKIVENGIKEIKKEYENDKNNNENKMRILNEKINTLNNQLHSNKISDEDKEQEKQKIFELDNNIKNLETKINEYEFDQLIENIAILTEKQNDTKIFDLVNNLEVQLNGIKEKVDKQERELNRNSLTKNKNNFDPEMTKKINNHENIILTIQSQLKKIQEGKNNDDNNKNKIEKKLTEIIKATNDLGLKTDSLFNITQKLENENKELSSKTNTVINNVTKLSSIYNSYPKLQTNKIPQENKQPKENYYKNQNFTNQYNQNLYYNKTTPNTNISTKNSFDSNIVNFEDIFFLFNRIKEINPKIHDINFRLVYRATEDGDRAADFHEKCDKIGPNIVLIKTQKGNVFGGFTFKNWEHMPRDIDENRPNLGSASRDSKAFGFNVNSQKIYNNERPKEFAIWCNKNYGPTFKNNLFQIFDSCLKKGGYCNVRNNSHFGGQMYDYEIAGGESRFRVEELEVFEVRLK